MDVYALARIFEVEGLGELAFQKRRRGLLRLLRDSTAAGAVTTRVVSTCHANNCDGADVLIQLRISLVTRHRRRFIEEPLFRERIRWPTGGNE